MFSYQNPIVQEDLKRIVATPLAWDSFQGKTILVTGATGMIATYITFLFLYMHEHHIANVHVIALCRNKDKASSLYGTFLHRPYFSLLIQDVCDHVDYSGSVDYIFHLAGNASPYAINHTPVDIMKSNLIGTINVLELARKKNSKLFFASTREVYGSVQGAVSIDENTFGYFDCMENRACYPESKRAAETLIKSYGLQYGVESYIARIAHSYGPGMKTKDDGRILADLIGNVLRGEDIVLKSDGSALRSFCYVSDVVIGILYIILKGESGQAYNLSNENDEITIGNLAMLLSGMSNGKSKVFYERTFNQAGYCNYRRVALSNSKIYNLGWRPQTNLLEGLERTLLSERN